MNLLRSDSDEILFQDFNGQSNQNVSCKSSRFSLNFVIVANTKFSGKSEDLKPEINIIRHPS